MVGTIAYKAALIGIALTASSTASAEILGFNFAGTYDSGVKAGQNFSGTVTYDASQPVYSGQDNALAQSANYFNYAFTLSNLMNISGSNDFSNRILVQDAKTSAVFEDFVAFDNFTDAPFIGFYGSYTTTAGVALPTFATLQSFSRRTIGTVAGSGTFTITALGTPAVPEPATWAMLTLGFGSIGYAMRRRDKARARIRFV